MNDVGDAAMTYLPLYMARLCVHAINAKYLPWDESLINHCTTTLWFTSFDKYTKNFRKNQRNMVTESIEMAFLFPRYDVQNTRVTTTEPCEHTFVGLRRDER